MQINHVMLLGNLTRDPETKHLPSGDAVAKFSLAVNERHKNKAGEQVESVLFIGVEAWGKTAELCQQYLRKGSEALVEGSLKMESWTTDAGEKRTAFKVKAARVQFGRRPKEDGAASDTPAGNAQDPNRFPADDIQKGDEWPDAPPAGEMPW